MNDIDLAKKELRRKELSLVIVKEGETLFATGDYGVRGLMQAIDEYGTGLAGSSVADRVVGRAAAMLCRYAGVKVLHAVLASENALATLKQESMAFTYEELVPVILNRERKGQCPFETLTADCADEVECYNIIKDFLRSMAKG